MGQLADALAPRPLHEQRVPFHRHEAKFHHALDLAERLEMQTHVAALTQSLAVYAQNTRSFEGAERLFQCLADHRAAQGDEEVEAVTYHQLGVIAQERRDFDRAEQWYRKSLAIEEKLDNEHGAASTYGQLGIVAWLRKQYEPSGQWLIKSIQAFRNTGDGAGAAQATRNFLVCLRHAPPAEQQKLRAMWAQAGLDPLPEDHDG